MRRRHVASVAFVLALLLAGCIGAGGTTSPTPTSDSGPSTPATPQPTATPAPTATPGACDGATAGVPDLRLYNRLDDPRTVTVTVTPVDGGAPVYDETLQIPAAEERDRFEVVPEQAEYTVSASLPDGTTGNATLEVTPGDRYSIVTVIVKGDQLFVEELGVHPEPTATPCDE